MSLEDGALVDLEAEGPLPVRFVLGRKPLDVAALAAAGLVVRCGWGGAWPHQC